MQLNVKSFTAYRRYAAEPIAIASMLPGRSTATALAQPCPARVPARPSLRQGCCFPYFVQQSLALALRCPVQSTAQALGLGGPVAAPHTSAALLSSRCPFLRSQAARLVLFRYYSPFSAVCDRIRDRR